MRPYEPLTPVATDARRLLAAPPGHQGVWDESVEANAVPQARPYLDALSVIHAAVRPTGYLEIGVRHGASLALARCAAIGIDPEPELRLTLSPSTRVVRATSDEFFGSMSGAIDFRIDLVFIDGLHLFECALRDFIAVERLSHRNTVVVIDDVLPNHPRQALRQRQTRVWMGDVWRLKACLESWRPDLRLTLLDTAPGGALVVTSLDPRARQLSDNYEAILIEPSARQQSVPEDVLERRHAIDVDNDVFRDLLSNVLSAREASDAGG